jgi:hypothetical protein
MKHFFRSSYILFAMLMTTMACNDSGVDGVYVGADEWNCRYVNTLGAIGLSQKLVGVWHWKYRTCWDSGSDRDDTSDIGLTVKFTYDQQVSVVKAGEVIVSSPYTFKADGPDDFVIETNLVPQLLGRIYFCDESVVFTDTYKDGCANYFLKE